jgi:hypothetical protein
LVLRYALIDCSWLFSPRWSSTHTKKDSLQRFFRQLSPHFWAHFGMNISQSASPIVGNHTESNTPGETEEIEPIEIPNLSKFSELLYFTKQSKISLTTLEEMLGKR